MAHHGPLRADSVHAPRRTIQVKVQAKVKRIMSEAAGSTQLSADAVLAMSRATVRLALRSKCMQGQGQLVSTLSDLDRCSHYRMVV